MDAFVRELTLAHINYLVAATDIILRNDPTLNMALRGTQLVAAKLDRETTLLTVKEHFIGWLQVLSLPVY